MKLTAIKYWAEDDRPREKLELKGKSNLSDVELLAILLGSGNRTLSAVELAREILSSVNNSVDRLAQLSLDDLMRFNGVGKAKAITVIAAIELSKRRKSSLVKNQAIKSSKQAFNYLQTYLSDVDHEQFYVMALNRSNQVLHVHCISKGGRTATIADGKIIFKFLLDVKATGAILAHNHPSGNLMPSHEDKRLTKQLIDFGKLIQMEILDHIIIGGMDYFSFRDDGLI